MAKKKSKKPALTPAKFKTTGGHAKMKVVAKSKKMYYFRTKVKPEKVVKTATAEGPGLLEVGASSIKVGRPTLKYDFYCIYDASLEMSFLRVRKREISVHESVKGVLVGKEVFKPKKGKEVPGPAVALDTVEMFEIKQDDAMTLDGKTGGPANTMSKLLKGPGKKTASKSWVKKNKISPGKFNSLEKVVKAVTKFASQRPSDAKKVVSHVLTFKKLEGYYVPVYYVGLSAGSKKMTLKVNGVNGAVSLAV
ncbi:MAG: hypothetical protein ACTSV3_00485 [Candidatus Thorarchaeota archaeon]|nr:MAG: hypothetical protein DRO87_08015 [Candidatus Thorarchaeota archaeon]RLI56783.1 MAG: hypothetical protein DRP09_05410 [Candidatus Thorarchaeota archaeon]